MAVLVGKKRKEDLKPSKWLRKAGTDEYFTWNKHLAMRDDMIPTNEDIPGTKKKEK